MAKNKQYNTRNIVRFSMLIAMLVLSSLLRTTLAVSRSVLSRKGSNQPICDYFDKIPTEKAFIPWIKRVEKIVADYKLKKYLTKWLKDLQTLEGIIILLTKDERKKMSFSALVEQYQKGATFPIIPMMGCMSSKPLLDMSPKLASIGNLSPGRWISIDPAIAVIDELYRESIRHQDILFPSPITAEAFELCLKIARQELKEDKKAKILALLTYNPLKELMSDLSTVGSDLANAASSVLNMFTGNTAKQDKGNKND